MTVAQIYSLVNTVTKEVIGEETIVQEDLSNLVDVGTAVFNANAVDRYIKSLVDHIGKVIFVNRIYKGRAPSVLMDGWEYGAVLEKISCKELPAAQENESWELEDGTSYDPNVFTKPKVEAKFYQKRVTFEIPISITDRQVKSAFSSVDQLNSFLSMITVNVENSMTMKNDELIMRTINSFAADTVYAEYQGSALSTKSGVRAVNLLYLYKQAHANATTTAANWMYDTDFLRFAAMEIFNITGRMSDMSTLFNIGGRTRFTPEDRLHVVMHSDFVNAADYYLQSSTFHDRYTALQNHDTISKWQASGSSYGFADTSEIKVVTGSGNTVDVTGVIAVAFDRDALGVANFNRRVTTDYNGKAEFTNYWHKADAGYFNDENENFVVFFVA